MSEFLAALRSAAQGAGGLTSGEPGDLQRRSWGEVHAEARAGARMLIDAGVRPGDAVALLAAAPADIAPAAQAVWLAGGSVTMLHQPTARTDLAHYATETATVLKVITGGWVLLGEPFLEFADRLRAARVKVLPIADLRQASPQADDGEAVEAIRGAGDPALLQLTSGSTATPKAVRITHGNLAANLASMVAAASLRARRDVMVSWLPLFHDMGMVGFLILPMSQGIDTVLVRPTDFLRRPLVWPELISQFRGTATAAPNFAYALTAKVLAAAGPDERLDLSSMRFLLNGAEPIDVAAARSFLAAGARFRLAESAMVCAYGMAEATLGVSFHPWGTPMKVADLDATALEHDRIARSARPGSVVRSFPVLGPPLPGMEVRVVAPDRTVMGERQVGVLQLRGESVTELYLTVDGPRPTRDSDGWLDTGDLGYLVDGEVVVCGRVKDVIIMGGRNLYPTDIERAAETVPGVRAGNAVAVRWTVADRRESFAVAVESREPDRGRLAAQVRTAVTVAMGARPALVRVLPPGTLPKTPSGKLRRAAAGKLLLDGEQVGTWS